MTTLTDLPALNLLPEDMAAATRLDLRPYLPAPAEYGWDLAARLDAPRAGPGHRMALSWTALAGKQYAARAVDAAERPLMMIFNDHGEPLALEYGGSADGSAFLHDFVAPYSGTFYLSPLIVSEASAPSVLLFADLDTGPVRTTNALTGSDGNDKLLSTMGADQINGGAGTDLLAYPGDRAAYKVVRTGTGLVISAADGLEGGDSVSNVEQLAFADGMIDLRYSTLAESLYLGYFGRAADPAGLRNFQLQLAALGAPDDASALSASYGSNAGIRQLIDSFGTSAESQALYPGATHSFVDAVYHNLLSRAPDRAGLDFWSAAIEAGHLTRANAALAILGGAQANTSAQGLIDAQTIAQKVSVAWNFTTALDMPAETALYKGDAAAAAARELLSMVYATTSPEYYQTYVDYAILMLAPARPMALPDSASAPAAGHEPPLELLGMAAQTAASMPG